jgi:hypothetical protein
MVNYRCSAACRHCLYACSPTRREGYVDRETMREICRLLRKGGIGSVHIGGGEPFLDFRGLVAAVEELRDAGIALDYIETNAFWAGDADGAAKLKQLKALHAEALCISVDPFHAEYIPYALPLRLAALCDKIGMGYFLWKQQFLPALSRLDAAKTHSRPEMEALLGDAYISDAARLYGLRMGGRAVNIEREYAGTGEPADFTGSKPCGDLLSTGHFHVDADCRFIPPGCTGILIPLAEAVEGIPEGKYPVFEALYYGGTGALLEFARGQGFAPEKNYPSRCGFCFRIRAFLAGRGFAELDADHYEESLKYY